MPIPLSRRVVLLGAVTAAVGLTGGCAGAPELGEQMLPQTSASAPRSPGAGAAGSPSPSPVLGSDKFYDLTVNVTNKTGSDLQLQSAKLAHENGDDGGHWDDRPADIPAGGSTKASAYAAVRGQGITLKYFGHIDGKVVTLTLAAQDPEIGSNNTNGTKTSGPISVQPSITNGRHSTATFRISSYAEAQRADAARR